MSVFDMGIATIFAREVLEAAIIITSYRTIIFKSEEWQGERETLAIKTVTKSAVYSFLFALVLVTAIAVPLSIASKQIDKRVVEFIEGVSKVIASICILQLSLKIPSWLGVYSKKKGEEDLQTGVTLKEIRFNVAWNIWREAAECGIFLFPYFIGSSSYDPKTIPVSALIGIAISMVLWGLIAYANNKFEDKRRLAFFLSSMTLMLAVGLFVGGCHDIEEVFGETRKIWVIENEFWSHKRLPMTLLKPFGYSASRTVLQMCCFWFSLLMGMYLHTLKIRQTRQRESDDENKPGETQQVSNWTLSEDKIEKGEQ